MNMAPAQPGQMNLQPPQAYPPTQDVMGQQPGQGAPPPGAPPADDMARNPVMTAMSTLTAFVSQLDPAIQQAFGNFVKALMNAGGGQAPAPAAPQAGPMQEPPAPPAPPAQPPMGGTPGQETMEQNMMRRGYKPMAQPVIM